MRYLARVAVTCGDLTVRGTVAYSYGVAEDAVCGVILDGTG